MKTNRIRLIALGMAWLVCLVALAGVPKRPNPPKLVNDLANVLVNDAVLEDTLERFAHHTSNQICVVTLNDLEGYEPSEMAYKIGQEWGVGDQRFNNGVVLLIKPKTATSSGKVFIATGYGVEGVLPDALCRRIIENKLIPAFRNNDYEAGVWNALAVMMPILKGEYDAEEIIEAEDEEMSTSELVITIIILILIIMWIRSRADGFGGGGGGFSTGTWGGSFGSGGHSSGWSGGGSSWGGFGGGSFGGGGAGGSW